MTMWLITFVVGMAAWSQAAPEVDSESATTIAEFAKEAAAYDIRLADRVKSRLEFVPQPLLKWSNPARTSEDGAVFLWVNDGRPQAIGSLFTYKLQKIYKKHEFHSLATVPLTGTFRDVVAWKAPLPGLYFAPVANAPAPAANARLRLIQLKSLAREFSAQMLAHDSGITELRLMPQPLYRYEGNGVEVLDGSLFSFALGTDPEALLLLEARRNQNDWRWEFAFARFHYAGIVATHKDREVFRVDRDSTQLTTKIGDPASRDKVYVTYHVD